VNFFFFLNTDFNALERKNCVAVKDTSFLINLKVQSLYFLKTVISKSKRSHTHTHTRGSEKCKKLSRVIFKCSLTALNFSNETFEVVLGTSSFLARHEVYGNTTENLVPCWRPYF